MEATHDCMVLDALWVWWGGSRSVSERFLSRHVWNNTREIDHDARFTR